ncbi:MAG: class A beta-lactamase-related serine hydrolase, partial [Actinomycetia bacterium]|nr:class A beta-lactamase-related serine hydrolase [Actinomycetes bacterium]
MFARRALTGCLVAIAVLAVTAATTAHPSGASTPSNAASERPPTTPTAPTPTPAPSNLALPGFGAAPGGVATGDASPPPTPSATASQPVSAPPTPTSTSPTASTATPTPAPKPTLRPARAVNAEVRELAAGVPAGGVSVAALNTATGAYYHAGATGGMRTASTYKLFVLEALLLQRQDSGSGLSSYDLSLATPMIENSDNVAAYQLFLNIGGSSGLAAAGARLGLRATTPGLSDPTLTTTSAADYLTLLKNLVSNRTLSAYSRS